MLIRYHNTLEIIYCLDIKSADARCQTKMARCSESLLNTAQYFTSRFKLIFIKEQCNCWLRPSVNKISTIHHLYSLIKISTFYEQWKHDFQGAIFAWHKQRQFLWRFLIGYGRTNEVALPTVTSAAVLFSSQVCEKTTKIMSDFRKMYPARQGFFTLSVREQKREKGISVSQKSH